MTVPWEKVWFWIKAAAGAVIGIFALLFGIRVIKALVTLGKVEGAGQHFVPAPGRTDAIVVSTPTGDETVELAGLAKENGQPVRAADVKAAVVVAPGRAVVEVRNQVIDRRKP